MTEPIVTTYSMWAQWRNCRKACWWRYVRELVPVKKVEALFFGSAIHDCLERWHRDKDLYPVLDHIDSLYPNRNGDENEKKQWHLARAMMRAYSERYAFEDFEVVALEKVFSGPIINPATGAPSRTFTLSGKVDGIIKKDGKFYILEHKTAAQVDAGYIDRLWCDFQTQLYAYYVEQQFGYRIAGVLYNILPKAKLRQSMGETEFEYEERKAALIAKSKTGKSSAKRKVPECDDDFADRLAAWYDKPDTFVRLELLVDQASFDLLRSELWELTLSYLDARRRDMYYLNTSQCYNFNRQCPYWPLCQSHGDQGTIDTYYEHKEANSELIAEKTPQSELPF